MTTFRLNAGRPAASPMRRAVRVDSTEEAADLKRMTYWAPNMERDTPLACGDMIPWPIIRAFGQHIHGQIWCDLHGWQPKITQEEIRRVRREAKSWQPPNQEILTPTPTESVPF